MFLAVSKQKKTSSFLNLAVKTPDKNPTIPGIFYQNKMKPNGNTGQ